MAKADEQTFSARLDQAVSALEQRTLELMNNLKEEGRKAEETAQEHIWVTILSALGLGLVLGLLLGLVRR